MTKLLEAMGIEVTNMTSVAQQLARAIDISPTSSTVWLALYILQGTLPTAIEVDTNLANLELQGARKWVRGVFKQRMVNIDLDFEICHDVLFTDVFHTSQTNLATGIQRVTRNTLSHWIDHSEVTPITWDASRFVIRRLSSDELFKASGKETKFEEVPQTALVPLSGRLILLELAAEEWRTTRLSMVLMNTSISLQVLGYDCVPISSSETSGAGMPHAFSTFLDIASRATRIATISDAANSEYSGWKMMLGAKGIDGPEIKSIMLASSTNAPTKQDQDNFLAEFNIDLSIPLLVCVGSHEPRKNHLAVLRAASRLWAEGHRFQLIFIGGNAWRSGYFQTKLRRLQEEGFPVQSLSALADSHLYSAMKLAKFTIFPSLNEGFGLPVSESLELGTPVITSNFGSTKQISEGMGGLLVDPRDDDSLTEGIKHLLTSPAALSELKKQTLRYKPKSWKQYSEELWDYFVSP